MFKKFDKKLYEENDHKGKIFASSILKKMYPSYNIVEGDKFGVDLKVIDPKDNSIFITAEVEVRHNWNNDGDFPFSTINIPYRKQKFFNGKCKYFSINKNLNRCLIIDDKDILNSPLEENPNKYVSSNEKFYKVPVEKAKSILGKDYIV